MPGSKTALGRQSARISAPRCVAFRYHESVGTQDNNFIAAQWLACTLPCRRFADILTVASARLGADADRYSFIVLDFHQLLLAGLPAHHGVIFRGLLMQKMLRRLQREYRANVHQDFVPGADSLVRRNAALCAINTPNALEQNNCEQKRQESRLHELGE
jgi:hypothetical protein